MRILVSACQRYFGWVPLNQDVSGVLGRDRERSLTQYLQASGLFTLNLNATGKGRSPGAMGLDILYRKVHTGPRQRKKHGSYCAGPIPCSCPNSIPVQCA